MTPTLTGEAVQTVSPTTPISALADAHIGTVCTVVGSGPSLRHLTAQAIPYAGPVIAVNYAIQVVEQLPLPNRVYSIQKDHHYILPRNATLLTHARESGWWEGISNQFMFDNVDDFGNRWDAPSVEVCVDIARLMGCVKVVFLCCDAATDQSTSKYEDGRTVYPANGANYLLHPMMVKARAAQIGMEVEWLKII